MRAATIAGFFGMLALAGCGPAKGGYLFVSGPTARVAAFLQQEKLRAPGLGFSAPRAEAGTNSQVAALIPADWSNDRALEVLNDAAASGLRAWVSAPAGPG